MKQIALTLCLLFTVTIGMICAQPMQPATAIPGIENGSIYAFSMVPPQPDAIPASLVPVIKADQLTMVASPNPFTSRTEITFSLPGKGKVILGIRNMFGETVKTIEENADQEGDHSIEVTSEHLRPGVYTAILILKTSDNVMMKTIRIVCNQ
jgi:hypothetical protein